MVFHLHVSKLTFLLTIQSVEASASKKRQRERKERENGVSPWVLIKRTPHLGGIELVVKRKVSSVHKTHPSSCQTMSRFANLMEQAPFMESRLHLFANTAGIKAAKIYMTA